MKRFSTEKIGHFIITVITAFISTFFMSSCMGLNKLVNNPLKPCVTSISSSSTAVPRAATSRSLSKSSQAVITSGFTIRASATTTTSPVTDRSIPRGQRKCLASMPVGITPTPSASATKAGMMPRGRWQTRGRRSRGLLSSPSCAV